ncbi:MAG: hypothetical protein ACE5D3_00030 [Candidatus Binatia bacterium]
MICEIRWEPKTPTKSSHGLIKAARLFEFIENELKIRTKRAVTIRAADGKRRKSQLVPFRFNAVQMILAQELAECWHTKVPFRRLIPKARQMGISTWFQAVFFGLCIGQPQYHVALIAHIEDGGDEIFSKAHTFERNLPAALAVDLEKRQGNRLAWVNGSTMWVGSIKVGDALGKGPTLSGIHFSECANFGDRGIDSISTATSIMNSVADSPDVIVAYESTAKGRDAFFWELCERALSDKYGIEDKVLFLPWYLDPDYKMSWEEYRRRLKGKSIPKTFRRTGEEKVLAQQLERVKVTKANCRHRYSVRLTDEQLIWRRFKIANDCYDQEHLFRRYYPATYEEAFSSTVTCMFAPETVDHYASGAKDALVRGNLVRLGSRIDYERDKNGRLRIWEEPIPGEEYVIGCDVGGERIGNDANAAYVLNKHTTECVAAYHGAREFDHLADDMCALGRYYNNAELVIENNHQPAVAKTAFKNGYPNLYHYYPEGSFRRTVQGVPGFNTNRRTRPELMAYLAQATRPSADGRILKCKDKWFAREMETFVLVDKVYKAQGKNKDDRIMAMAIAIYRCAWVVEKDRAEEAKQKNSWAYDLFLKIQDEESRDDMRSGGGILVL